MIANICHTVADSTVVFDISINLCYIQCLGEVNEGCNGCTLYEPGFALKAEDPDLGMVCIQYGSK